MTALFRKAHRDLLQLDSTGATELFRALLWCEARRCGTPIDKIVVSLRTTVADGGIDAQVSGPSAIDSLLISGTQSFQVKSGAAFKPWVKSRLESELFGSSRAARTKATLAPGVRDCMNAGGRYVLVSFGHDLTPSQQRSSEGQLKSLFKGCGYRKPEVLVLGQGQLLGLLERYPSLWLPERYFLDFNSWKRQDHMSPPLHAAAAQEQFVEKIRSVLRAGETQHLRVVGEPGIGKTRLVLEALAPQDLSASVLYVPQPEDFQGSQLFVDLIRADSQQRAVLVIDDCLDRDRASIWSALKGKPGISLITIDHGPGHSADGMQVLECPPLPEAEIQAILKGHVGDTHSITRWAEMCEGSPRVAHAVGENLRRNPDDLLRAPATVPIWDRFVAGYEPLENERARRALTILRHVGLFQRFGFEDPVSSEARFISGMVKTADPTITWAIFQEHVTNLRQRRVLQGKRTLAIVPKALHIYLWLDFWNQHGRGFEFTSFLKDLPPSLQHWFFQLFIYAHASPVAQDLVARILSRDGPFTDSEFLESENGARFIYYLAEADPGKTLELIQRTFGSRSEEQLLGWRAGRQHIVWALSKIAVWSDHFRGAAQVLVKMALSENDKASNNSTGTVCGLFSVVPGFAATQASPDHRLPILIELLEAPSLPRRKLGLQLCEAWLSPRGGIRVVGPEHQGLRTDIPFWRAKTWGEMFDAWRTVWNKLWDISRSWPDDERRLANSVLISSGSELLGIANIASEVLQTWGRLVDDPATDLQQFTRTIIRRRRMTGSKAPGVDRGLVALDRKITGSSFWTRFSRFVLYTDWDETYRLRRGKMHESKAPGQKTRLLAKEAAANPGTLIDLLPRFVAARGHRLYEFGSELLKASKVRDLPERTITLQLAQGASADTQFLGGMLNALRSERPADWDALMLKLLNEASSRDLAVNLTLRTGYSVLVLTRMLELFREGLLEPAVFAQLFFDARRSVFPESVVLDVVAALTASADQRAHVIAIELVDYYCCEKESPRAFDEQVIVDLMSKPVSEDDRQGMSGFHLCNVMREFRKRFPHRDMDILAMLLPQLNTFISPETSDRGQVAYEITKDRPKQAWHLIARALEQESERLFGVLSWLGGGTYFEDKPNPAAFGLLDPVDVIAWIRVDKEHRAGLVCANLPRTLDGAEGRLTQLFIQEICEDDDMALSLISHFQYGEGWMGEESAHLGRLRDRARKWLSESTTPAISAWLERYIARLSLAIPHAELREERE